MIRVWHIDIDEMMREALGLTLATTRDVDVERSLATIEELPSAGAAPPPDVIVLEPWTQPVAAFHPCAIVANRLPGTPLLVHTARTRPEDVGRVLVAGACGLVHKRMGRFALLRAIRRVVSVRECVVVGLDGTLSSEDAARATNKLAVLTPRELEVLQCVAVGQTSKEAADLLGVSNRTVETHRRNMMARLEVKSRAELIQLAVLAGLGPPDSL